MLLVNSVLVTHFNEAKLESIFFAFFGGKTMSGKLKCYYKKFKIMIFFLFLRVLWHGESRNVKKTRSSQLTNFILFLQDQISFCKQYFSGSDFETLGSLPREFPIEQGKAFWEASKAFYAFFSIKPIFNLVVANDSYKYSLKKLS